MKMRPKETPLSFCAVFVSLACSVGAAFLTSVAKSHSPFRPPSCAGVAPNGSLTLSRHNLWRRGLSSSSSSSASSCSSSSALRARKEATFGMGCFWEPSESMMKVDGVIATTVGYAGGEVGAPPPTYETVCSGGRDWVESVRVVYEDDALSFEGLLDAFFESQKPAPSRQYASVIFAASPEEEECARRWLEAAMGANRRREKDGLPASVVQIEPLTAFFRAEGYHQEYWSKWRVRLAVFAVLFAGESGAFRSLMPSAEASGALERACMSLAVAGCVAALVERLVVRNVREMVPGDLVATTTSDSE